MKGTCSVWFRGALGVALVAGLASTAFAQAAAKAPWKQGRTPDGQPDLQGIYLLFDPTPFEAPGAPPRTDEMPASIGPADDFAIFNHKQPEKRRSMVVDPPDGFVPVMKWAEDERDYHLAHIPDAPEHETPWVRCITRGYPAGMFPAGYNNAIQIWQTPGYVILNMEMIHETRIIPIDGRPKLNEKIKQWNGEPRGRWEGDTLVVESTNHPELDVEDFIRRELARSARLARGEHADKAAAPPAPGRASGPPKREAITLQQLLEGGKVHRPASLV